MDGLRFSQKASTAMLLRNYWKIIKFDFTPMPNAGGCHFACGDVEPNSP